MAPARRLRKRRNPEEKPADGNRGEDAAVAASPQEVISKRKRKVTRKREEEEEAGAKTPADSIAGRTSLASKVAAKKRKTEEISLSLPRTARRKKETLRKEASPAPSTGEGAPLVKPHRPLTSPAAKLAEKVKTARTKRAPLEGRARNGRSVSPSRKKQTRVLKASKSTSKPRDESDCEVTEPTPRATTASRRKLPPEGAGRKPRGRLSTKVRADGDSQRENPQAVSLMLKEEPSVKYGGDEGGGGGGGGDAVGVSPQAGPSGKESPKKTLKGGMMSSESSESEWEEVQDFSHPPLPPPLVKPAVQHDIKITVETKADKKKKDKYSAESYFKSLWNKLSKDVRTSLHQVHLLCYLSHGLHCSSVCNSEELQAVALSLLPARYTVAAATEIDRAVLTALINWFKSFVVVETDDVAAALTMTSDKSLFQRMSDCLATRRVPSSREYILLFAIFLRSLSVLTRLVYNLQPTSLKPESQAKVYKKQPVKKSVKGGGKQTKRRSRGQRHTMRRRRAATNPEFTDSDEETFRDPKQETDERVVRKMRKIDRTEVSTPGGSRKSMRTRPTPTNYKVGVSSSDDGDGDDSNFSDDMDKVDQSPEKKLQQFRRESLKEKKARQTARKKKQEQLSDNSDTELVRELDRLESWGTQKSAKNRSLARSAESVDDPEVVYDRGPSNDLWLEFYVKSKNRWTCFDCITGSIDDPRDLERRASQPIHYVVGIDNDNCTKDLTPRYASDWMTNARRFRTDGDWWADTLATRQCQDLLRDKEEDLQLKDDMLAMPLPSSVSEFKGHPLYALRRHLLKFEAIYPPTAQPLGIIRGEPVYARECVRNLHSKETWLKEARSIKKDEKAYKMVKPRPKRGESTGEPMAATLKVYGEWQTEPYQSPPVENGIIPRNDYGNVELFQPSMLPPGAVHLNLAGLHKVAKKLGVDCVAAMVGWDFHGGWNHPVMDGYVVCEEHEVILRDAWQQEQDEADRRQREKREKKVLARWKLLVKGLLIRERLRRRWDLRHPPACGTSSQEESTTASVEAAWPRNFDSGERDTYHLFPFEKK